LLLTAWLAACAGTVPAPMVQVPLFRRAGEVEAGLVMGPATRRPEIGGTVRAAATDWLRLGASVSGAGGPMVSHGDTFDPRDHAPRLFADGMVGAEWGGLVFRFGLLAGAGYGRRDTVRCGTLGASPRFQASCSEARADGDSSFVRSYGQLHFAFAPPGPLAASLALRVPVVVELPHGAAARRTELGSEVALTQTVRFRYLRLDLQPLWSQTRGFAFHVALLLRFAAQ
jgi:hypothetical protein